MSEYGSLDRIDDGNRIDSSFCNVETGAFTIHYHPGRDDSTQAGQFFGGRKLNGFQQLECTNIKCLNGVIVCICDPDAVAVNVKRIWC